MGRHSAEQKHVEQFIKEAKADTGKIVIDERFRELTRQYRMHETPERLQVVRSLYSEAIEESNE